MARTCPRAARRKSFVRRLAESAIGEQSAYLGTIARAQYILRFPDHDEQRWVEHNGHAPGQRIELDGLVWTIESIVRTRRWNDVDRVFLRPADSTSERAQIDASGGSEPCGSISGSSIR